MGVKHILSRLPLEMIFRKYENRFLLFHVLKLQNQCCKISVHFRCCEYLQDGETSISANLGSLLLQREWSQKLQHSLHTRRSVGLTHVDVVGKEGRG